MWIQNADQNIWNLLQKADLTSASLSVEEGNIDLEDLNQNKREMQVVSETMRPGFEPCWHGFRLSPQDFTAKEKWQPSHTRISL
jgi:hypothetical protein